MNALQGGPSAQIVDVNLDLGCPTTMLGLGVATVYSSGQQATGTPESKSTKLTILDGPLCTFMCPVWY